MLKSAIECQYNMKVMVRKVVIYVSYFGFMVFVDMRDLHFTFLFPFLSILLLLFIIEKKEIERVKENLG